MKDPNVKISLEGKLGEKVLDVALRHNIDIEGACGGEMACSTCHVILDQELYDKLPKKTEEEQDMLDLAWGLQPT
jgi:ferredoxin, 2Fe-2S